MNLYSMMSEMHGGMGMVAERAAAATGEVTISETRDVPIPALRTLHETAPWARGRSRAQLRTLLRHSDIFLTAWDGNTLVGCARVPTDFTVRALICDVIVHPAYQGRGIGRLLVRSEEHTSELQSLAYLVCRLLLEKKKQ